MVNIDEQEIINAAKVIKDGGLVLFPTETVYGIGANGLNEQAVKNIFKAKGRASDNPLILHISSNEMLKDIAKDISELEYKLMDAFWPGPFTIVLNKTDIVPTVVTGGLDTVAVRMPRNKIANRLIHYAGVPIAAPSANISGKPSGTCVHDVYDELKNSMDYIIDGGKCEVGIESTVVKVEDGSVRILRPGRITKEDIENICLVNLQKYDLKKKAFLSLRGILKSVFDLAFSEYWITDNVYQRVIFKKFNDMLIPDTPTHKRVHSQKEFSDILKELHRKQKARPKFTTYWALELQMIMGLRRGEIPPLRWKKDVTETFVSITREQLTADNEYIIVEHTKNHKDRFFPITNDLEEFFIRLKSMHEKYYPDSEFLFPADTPSGCITNNAVYKVYQGICKSLGIEIVKDEIKGPHSFRRNAITEVVNSTNGNVVLASALFGNSPQVAKENYYTGANLAIAKEILDKRVLIQK